MQRLDSNPFIADVFVKTTRFLAARRGFLMLVGTGLTILSLITTIIVMLIIVSSEQVASIWLLMLIPAILLHVAIITGFIGVMMVIPLGQSYGG